MDLVARASSGRKGVIEEYTHMPMSRSLGRWPKRPEIGTNCFIEMIH